MRGNRPDENLQLDGDPQVLDHFARMSRIHAALAPYVATLCVEAVETGLPLQRPLFLHHEDDPNAFAVDDAFLYGRDLLVAPVIEADRMEWPVYLPAGAHWVHLWSGETFEGGKQVTVGANIGAPPVFYRGDSVMRELFTKIADL